jgi:hypothetical protein
MNELESALNSADTYGLYSTAQCIFLNLTDATKGVYSLPDYAVRSVLEMFQNQSNDKNKEMIRDFVRTNPHLMPDVISMLKDE